MKRRSSVPWWKPALSAGGDLVLALVLMALLLRAVSVFGRAQDALFTRQTARCHFTTLPPNDDGLRQWLNWQIGVGNVGIVRTNADVTVRYRLATGFQPLMPPWAALGYRGGQVLFSSSLQDKSASATHMLLELLAVQIPFLGVGWFRWRANALPSAPNNPAFPEWKTDLITGGLISSFFAWFYVLYGAAARLLAGRLAPTLDVDYFAPSFAPALLLAYAVLLVVVAPVCEEMFFRGGFFGVFEKRGFTWLGAVLSASVFSALHWDARNFLARFAFGLAMAWAFRARRSLLAPITAHSVGNGVYFLLQYSHHHGQHY